MTFQIHNFSAPRRFRILNMVTVTVNGEKRQITENAMVADLLRDLELGGRRVAVERNREIVGRDSYASAVVRDGDVFEIIEFVGGGF